MKPDVIEQDRRPHLQAMAQQIAMLKNESAKKRQAHLLCSALKAKLNGERL